MSALLAGLAIGMILGVFAAPVGGLLLGAFVGCGVIFLWAGLSAARSARRDGKG